MHHSRSALAVFLWLAVCTGVPVVTVLAINSDARIATCIQKESKTKADEAVFHEYKGVTIGMNAEEVRKKLGTPLEKDDEQDFYVFSDTESAQVYYDKAKTVNAISVNFIGEGSGVPKPKEVVGTDVKAKPDGSKHELIRFPKAGYWVSYSRTAGDSPIITITVKKIE